MQGSHIHEQGWQLGHLLPCKTLSFRHPCAYPVGFSNASLGA